MYYRKLLKLVIFVEFQQVFFTGNTFASGQFPKEIQGMWGENCLAPEYNISEKMLRTRSSSVYDIDSFEVNGTLYKIYTGKDYRLFKITDGKLSQEAIYIQGKLETTKSTPLERCDTKRVQDQKNARWKALSEKNSGKQYEIVKPPELRPDYVYPKERSARSSNGITISPTFDGDVRIDGGYKGTGEGVYGLVAFRKMYNSAAKDNNITCVNAFSKIMYRIRVRGESDYNVITAQMESLDSPVCIKAYGWAAE